MSALTELPAIATGNDWVVDTAEPDHFGDVRATAISDAGTVRMVFDDCGSLSGGYFTDRRRRNWHTTRVGDVKRWLSL